MDAFPLRGGSIRSDFCWSVGEMFSSSRSRRISSLPSGSSVEKRGKALFSPVFPALFFSHFAVSSLSLLLPLTEMIMKFFLRPISLLYSCRKCFCCSRREARRGRGSHLWSKKRRNKSLTRNHQETGNRAARKPCTHCLLLHPRLRCLPDGYHTLLFKRKRITKLVLVRPSLHETWDVTTLSYVRDLRYEAYDAYHWWTWVSDRQLLLYTHYTCDGTGVNTFSLREERKNFRSVVASCTRHILMRECSSPRMACEWPTAFGNKGCSVSR